MTKLRALAAGAALFWLAACGHAPAPPPASAAPPTIEAQAPAKPSSTRQTPRQAHPANDHARDLSVDELAGGHTLGRHVGRTDAQLRARLEVEPNISAASTWTDRETAERVVGQALEEQQSKVAQWTRRSGSKPNLTLNIHVGDKTPIGRSMSRRGRASVPCHDALVVLKARGDGFYVLTSYPEMRR